MTKPCTPTSAVGSDGVIHSQQREHHWWAWCPYDVLTAGKLVSEKQYYDAGGMQCMDCKRTVIFWDEKYREDVGKIERRDTGKSSEDCPSTGCIGPLPILLCGP